jgi:FKBP-type peptidyl-prolyl cis-trans isomerase
MESVSNEYQKSPSTGIEYYEYKLGDGVPAKFGDKVVYNYKGRLAGTLSYP